MNYEALDSGKFDVVITTYIRRPKDGDAGYVSSYTTYGKQPGEDWNRGNDLSDGPATAETVNQVAEDIQSVLNGTRL